MPGERMGVLPSGSYLGPRRKRRNKPVCRCAVCSLLVLSKRAAFAGWESNRGFLKNQFKLLIERGVPVEVLGRIRDQLGEVLQCCNSTYAVLSSFARFVWREPSRLHTERLRSQCVVFE